MVSQLADAAAGKMASATAAAMPARAMRAFDLVSIHAPSHPGIGTFRSMINWNCAAGGSAAHLRIDVEIVDLPRRVLAGGEPEDDRRRAVRNAAVKGDADLQRVGREPVR